MRSAFGWVVQVLTWLVLLLCVGALTAAVLVPRIFGGTPYTVLTGSMEPGFPPGTLVVVKPVAPDQIRQGDVITFQLESGKSAVVTHRVVGVGTRLDGKKVFTTQGDANDSADLAPVRSVQVRGRLWYSVPFLGYANTALNGGQRQTAVYVASGLLGGYAAMMLIGAVLDRKRTGRRAVSTGPQQENHHDGHGEEVVHEDATPALRSARNRLPATLATLILVTLAGAIYLRARRDPSTRVVRG